MSFDHERTLRKHLGLAPDDYLTTEQIATDYAFSSREAVRKAIKRWGCPHTYRGRTLIVSEREFKTAMEREGKRIRRRAA